MKVNRTKRHLYSMVYLKGGSTSRPMGRLELLHMGKKWIMNHHVDGHDEIRFYELEITENMITQEWEETIVKKVTTLTLDEFVQIDSYSDLDAILMPSWLDQDLLKAKWRPPLDSEIKEALYSDMLADSIKKIKEKTK